MYHALIIEDSFFYRELVTDVILLNGYNGLVCEEKGDVARLIKKHKSLKLILLDLELEGQDGVEILRCISNSEFEGFVVIISGVEDSILSSTLLFMDQLGLKHLPPIKKPFNHSELLNLLNQYLSSDQLNNVFNQDVISNPIETDLRITQSELEELIDGGHLVNFYQPITSLSTDKLKSFECLSRIVYKDGQYLFPEQYIHLLDTSSSLSRKHLLSVLSNLEKDCFKLKDVQEDVNICLNLTGQDISDLDLPDQINQYLSGTGIQNKQVTLEIKHVHTANCFKTVLDVLIRLRLKGFSLSIDDFGSGTEELKQLRHLPFSGLKIDKSLIDRVKTDLRAQTIVKNIIQLAHSLNMTVTAECVEDEDTAQILKVINCDQAQGHFYALPDNVENISDYLHFLNEHSESTIEDGDLKHITIRPLSSEESDAHENVLQLIENHLDKQTISKEHKHNIAMCVPLSGKLAALGKSYYLGANLAFFTQRELSSDIRKNVNFTVYNSYSSTKSMVDLMLKPEMDSIDSWIGPICPLADSRQLIHAIEGRNKILFAPYNGSHEFHNFKYHNIFNFKNSYYEELKKISQYCDRTGGRKCLLMNHSAMGMDLKKLIESELPEIEVMLIHADEEGNIDSIVQHLKKTKPQHLLFVSSQKLFINIILSYRDYNCDCHFYTVSLIPISAIKSYLPDNIENVYITTSVPSLQQNIQVVNEFWSAVKNTNLSDAKRFVNAIALEAFIAMKLSLKILQDSDYLKTPLKLNRFLEKNPIVNIGFPSHLHWSSPQREFGPTTSLLAFSDGEFIEIN